MSELILYTSDDGRTRLDIQVEGQTVWLSQLEIAELFQTTKQNVSLHAKNIFEDAELAENSVVKESLTTAADGKRYKTKHYNLDLILAIGYRVRSPRGVQFRQWASTHLKEYLVKGFVMDDERFKNPGATPIIGSDAPSRARKSIETDDVLFATVRPTLKRIALIRPQLRPRRQKVPDRDRRNRQVDHPPAKNQRGPPRYRPQPPPRQRQGAGRHH